MHHGKEDIATGTVAHARAKNIVGRGWALTLARRGSRRGRGCGVRSGLVPASYSILSVLLAPLLPAVVGGAVATAGLDAPPSPCRLLTVVTAVSTLRLRRDKQAFAVFQETAARTTVGGNLWPSIRKTMK